MTRPASQLRLRGVLGSLALAAALGLAVGGACRLAAGATLDALLTPLPVAAGLAMWQIGPGRPARRLWTGAATAAAWAAGTSIWWWPLAGDIGLAGLLGGTLLLAALALAAVTWGNVARRGTAWRALVAVTVLGWVTWPIWLGPEMARRGLDVPTTASQVQPVLAMNTAAREMGIWTEQPLAYALTPLGQDVAYALPSSPAPSILAHAAVGGLGAVAMAAAPRRWRRLSPRAGRG